MITDLLGSFAFVLVGVMLGIGLGLIYVGYASRLSSREVIQSEGLE